jgi:hypothetical protein
MVSKRKTLFLEPKTPVVTSEILMPNKSTTSDSAVTLSVAIERGVPAV